MPAGILLEQLFSVQVFAVPAVFLPLVISSISTGVFSITILFLNVLSTLDALPTQQKLLCESSTRIPARWLPVDWFCSMLFFFEPLHNSMPIPVLPVMVFDRIFEFLVSRRRMPKLLLSLTVFFST